MKTVYLIVLILITLVTCSNNKEREDYFDQKGNKISKIEFTLRKETGTIINYYENGREKALITMKNGDPLLIKEWHENGKLKRKTEYTKSFSNWKEISWYENGEKEKEIEIKKCRAGCARPALPDVVRSFHFSD